MESSHRELDLNLSDEHHLPQQFSDQLTYAMCDTFVKPNSTSPRSNVSEAEVRLSKQAVFRRDDAMVSGPRIGCSR